MIPIRWLSWTMVMGAAIAQTSQPAGDYSGMLGSLHVKLHLKAAGGAMEGTLDSVDQGSLGMRCENFRMEAKSLSFEVPVVGGKWHGTVTENGAVLQGSWSQGAEMPLTFRRDPAFEAAEKPSRVDGIWLGSIGSGRDRLRLQVQVKSDRAGQEYCSVDSLDQGVMGLPCDNVQLQGERFSFSVPSVEGKWAGTLSADGNELKGKWSQGGDVTLNFARQKSALTATTPEAKEDAALPPVSVRELKAVLDRDLAAALKDGSLAPATGGAVVIGVVQHGVRQILVYGPAKEDFLFEIGSISKTFTGLIFAQMAGQHKVRLDEPVRALLPPGTVTKPEGVEITLLDLATQHSGLPRLPDNLHAKNLQDPYANYQPAYLYEYLAKHGVKKPAGAGFGYSNLGVGLLGQALANRAGVDYAELLRTEIAAPLKMNDTAVKLSPELEKRLIQGHDAQHHAARPWDLASLTGAGGIRSTAGDMLIYLEAQLHPDRVKDAALASALQMSHELRADAFPKMKIALAWLYQTETGTYWHDGGTGGYSSYTFFNPKEDYAAVVLYNTTLSPTASFASQLGEHVEARLLGKPAATLH